MPGRRWVESTDRGRASRRQWLILFAGGESVSVIALHCMTRTGKNRQDYVHKQRPALDGRDNSTARQIKLIEVDGIELQLDGGKQVFELGK